MGVVCSPLESSIIHEKLGQDFLTVTPGIRLADDSKDDQKRVTTPAMARELTSSYIVVGRTITKAQDPLATYRRVLAEFQGIIKEEMTMSRESIAKHLLDIQAVFLKPNDPFTWASGIKSPIYCDNRLTLSYPEVRKDIEQELAELVKKEYPECECLMGTSTAGIPHAALVADILDLPMGYVRGGAKSHGRHNQIEGKVEKGMKVVVVEDLISTGGSSLECVEALRQAGCEVIGLVAIFTYGLPASVKKFG